MARRAGATDVIDFAQEDVFERIRAIGRGEGADGVIDCVGMGATAGHGIAGVMSTLRERLTSTERPSESAEAIRAARPCGIVSIQGCTAARCRSKWAR